MLGVVSHTGAESLTLRTGQQGEQCTKVPCSPDVCDIHTRAPYPTQHWRGIHWRRPCHRRPSARLEQCSVI
jgi:hypothetical protein